MTRVENAFIGFLPRDLYDKEFIIDEWTPPCRKERKQQKNNRKEAYGKEGMESRGK